DGRNPEIVVHRVADNLAAWNTRIVGGRSFGNLYDVPCSLKGRGISVEVTKAGYPRRNHVLMDAIVRPPVRMEGRRSGSGSAILVEVRPAALLVIVCESCHLSVRVREGYFGGLIKERLVFNFPHLL